MPGLSSSLSTPSTAAAWSIICKENMIIVFRILFQYSVFKIWLYVESYLNSHSIDFNRFQKIVCRIEFQFGQLLTTSKVRLRYRHFLAHFPGRQYGWSSLMVDQSFIDHMIKKKFSIFRYMFQDRLDKRAQFLPLDVLFPSANFTFLDSTIIEVCQFQFFCQFQFVFPS